jgi:hypothetical protein
MQKLKQSVLIAIVAIAAACATSYQPKGFTGGFSETQITANSFQVYFHGNAKTGEERAEDFTLLRSAEVSLEHGFPYFIVVDERAGASTSVYTMPTQTTTTGQATAMGNTAFGSATSTTTGGHSFLIHKPSLRNTIVCFKEKPDVQGIVYEAEFVAHSIAAKYGMATTH